MFKRNAKIIVVHFLIMLLVTTAYSQEETKADPSPGGQDIKRMIFLLGTDIELSGILGQKIAVMREAYPGVPDELWDELVGEIDMDEFLGALAPVHEKYLTGEEVQEIIKFYESPVGVKIRQVLPKIKEEALREGAQRQSDIVNRIMRKLEEKGYSSEGAGGAAGSPPKGE